MSVLHCTNEMIHLLNSEPRYSTAIGQQMLLDLSLKTFMAYSWCRHCQPAIGSQKQSKKHYLHWM